MTSPSDETEQFAPDPEPTLDTAQFPVTRAESESAETRPQHAVSSDVAGITRGGWWAITIAAAVLLILGFALTFGPARYWAPVPAVFLGYFLISGVIGLVFWKGVRELRDSNPNLDTHEPASTGARVAAAIGALGVASALVLLPAGLTGAPANALPCPDGSNTCGPTAPTQDQPTQGNGGNTTAPQAPQTTIPPNADTGLPQVPTQGNGNGFQGTVQQMPTPDNVDPNSCIFNCGPTQGQQAPQTGQATPPQTGQQQSPVTTAPNTPATTPQRPVTTTPKLRTPTPETTTSTSSKARDNEQRSSNEDREKNPGIPYQAAEIAALAGTYRRRKISESAARGGRVVSENVTRTLLQGGGKYKQDPGTAPDPATRNPWPTPASTGLTEAQFKNALAIVREGQRLGMDRKAITIALDTAITESHLLVHANDGTSTELGPDQPVALLRSSLQYPHQAVGNDHASVGLFQQQLPWYGNVQELMDPATSARVFYTGNTPNGTDVKKGLNSINYASMTIWDAAQTVQQSFDPTGGNYKVNAQQAIDLAAALDRDWTPIIE